MKIAYIALVITALATCNKAQMNTALLDTIASQDSLVVSRINYADSTHVATFYPGYTQDKQVTIKKETITELVTALRDTTNYTFADSRNCVMKAQYGFKIDSDNTHFVVMLSKMPCMKLSVINRANNTEQTIDLKDDNKVIGIVERIFK